MKAKPLRILFDATHHGKYDFEDFLSGELAAHYDTIKVKGRTVHRPDKPLKAYHAFLNTFLCEQLAVNERVVRSYRKGSNLHDAVAVHARSRAFFQADISNFFDSIDRNLVRATILERGSHVPITDLDSHLDRILALTTPNGTLPMGFSTSPPISNACLTGFDDDLEAHCRGAGLRYTRYADDIVISAHDHELLRDIAASVSALLMRHFRGLLQLNPAKSKLTRIGRKISILGMVILPTGQVTLDMALKQRIEVQLHFYLRDREKFLARVGNDMDAGVKQLAGYVNHVNSVDKAYLEKLRKKFGSTVIDSFLHRSAPT
jgi:RNA-directed DNA polymerase